MPRTWIPGKTLWLGAATSTQGSSKTPSALKADPVGTIVADRCYSQELGLLLFPIPTASPLTSRGRAHGGGDRDDVNRFARKRVDHRVLRAAMSCDNVHLAEDNNNVPSNQIQTLSI